ncbi:MAG: SDR family NAD(P)-dependent oxidoreductase [Bacteroidales bacterium]|jgi:short-subunit dehydrogenase
MKSVPTNGYCVVTGAAHGLGRAFALELSRRHINTILVDLPENDLPALCQEIREQYQVLSYCYECDLTQKTQIIELAERINKKHNIFLLINNAGTGGIVRFENATIDYLDRIMLSLANGFNWLILKLVLFTFAYPCLAVPSKKRSYPRITP